MVIRFFTARSIKRSLLLLLLAALAATGWRSPLLAQTASTPANQAGLVVVHADGSVVNRCVAFDEESISGYELLVRGGFAPRSEVTAMGASVCSLDGQGCGEGEDCFCQCQSSPCAYWTFWQQLPEGWRYSNAGPANVQVHAGDVQGWVWGESKPNSSAESVPPSLAFGDICSSDAVIYGIEGSGVNAPNPGAAMTQPWMVALVVGAPLLLAGAWWLWQRRGMVQP
jgi:hypothetical protein